MVPTVFDSFVDVVLTSFVVIIYILYMYIQCIYSIYIVYIVYICIYIYYTHYVYNRVLVIVYTFLSLLLI